MAEKAKGTAVLNEHGGDRKSDQGDKNKHITLKDVDDKIKSFSDSVLENQSAKSHAEHATDFEPPLYNVWKQQTKSAGTNHYGNSEIRWLDNLLYAYSKPFDIVIDPFAGGGSTNDICRERYSSEHYFMVQ